MSLSPSSSLVSRAIDLKYANRQRAESVKWILINGALFVVFTLDLWHKCPGYTGALHYVEAALAAGAAASALRHALRLLPRAGAAPAALSRVQRRLLGLAAEPLDASFRDAEPARAAPAAPRDEPAQLSPPRAWRAQAARAPPAEPAPSPERAPRDEFIADAAQLERYLSSVRREAEPAPAPAPPPPPPPPYQLSPLRAEAPEAAAARTPPGAEPVWRRLDLDPARLAHFNLNLRRWLHASVLERLVREMEAVDAALAGAGLEARVGAAAAARLAALAGAAPPALARRLRALLPFLRPFADQAYVARRVRELARGGCLAAYRWDAGGAGWAPGRPTDAELVLHLFAAYLDGVVPGAGAGAGAFTAAHLTAAPAPPPRAPGSLALHRAAAAPPHYLVALDGALLEAGRGRDNLLHSLLLFIAAAARREPPALLRLHLGPAGLNLLWVLDR